MKSTVVGVGGRGSPDLTTSTNEKLINLHLGILGGVGLWDSFNGRILGGMSSTWMGKLSSGKIRSTICMFHQPTYLQQTDVFNVATE